MKKTSSDLLGKYTRAYDVLASLFADHSTSKLEDSDLHHHVIGRIEPNEATQGAETILRRDCSLKQAQMGLFLEWSIVPLLLVKSYAMEFVIIHDLPGELSIPARVIRTDWSIKSRAAN